MVNPLDLTDHTILVTGASSGIGRETSVLLSRLGARLILVARNAERLAQTAAMLDGECHQVEIFDLSATDDIPRWLKCLTGDVGPLQGLVHCAGTQITRPVRFLTTDDVDEVMRLNVAASVALAKGFRQRGCCSTGASIVFVASIMGLVGQSGISAYCASKGAMIALTKSLALELAHESIRVNCVAPGHVKTEMAERLQQSLTSEQMAMIEAMHPLGFGTALDVAYGIAFLLAGTGRWITGSTLVVDGGYTAH